MQMDRIFLTVDRPFVFFIVIKSHDSGFKVLFSGKVANPPEVSVREEL